MVTSAGLRAADIVRYIMSLSEKTFFVPLGFTDILKGFACISDKGACGGQALRKAYQIERRHRTCEKNMVRPQVIPINLQLCDTN